VFAHGGVTVTVTVTVFTALGDVEGDPANALAGVERLGVGDNEKLD